MMFETRDNRPSRVEKGWNRHADSKGEESLGFTTSADFLIAKDKENKRPGFIELELHPGETPMAAMFRMNIFSEAAITRRWQRVDQFIDKENDNQWEVLVGTIHVHQDQRSADLFDDTGNLPFILEWQTPAWLYRQLDENFLNRLTGIALNRPGICSFLFGTQKKCQSGEYLPGGRKENITT